jgi:hypothetical protein
MFHDPTFIIITTKIEERTSTTTMTTTAKKSLEMASPRDTDELEGALLPPVAVPVNENPQLAAAAVPVTAFVYDESQDAVTAEADIPTAPFLPLYQNEQSREEVEQQAIAKGKRRGKIEAESEKQAVGKASREHYSKNYHAARRVEVANDEARRRNQEGVHVKEDKYTVRRSGDEKKDEQQDLAFPSSYKNGYEVAEYETSDYHASDDYEVSEYKSVYDP